MSRVPVLRFAAAATTALAAFALPAGAATSAARATSTPGPTGPAGAGTTSTARPIVFGLGDPTESQRFATQSALGGKAGVVGSFATKSNSPDFWGGWARSVRQDGAVLQLFWDPTPGRKGDPHSTLRAVLAGEHDIYIKHWTRQVAQYGHPVIIRLWAEMNGNWHPYSPGVNGNTASQFGPAWRHVVALARGQGANNIVWAWNPDKPYNGATPLGALWPGGSYVDWVGLDVYNWGDAAHGGWHSFSSMMGPAVASLRAVAGNKPLMLNEVGCADRGGDKAAWLREMFATMPRYGVRAFGYFDYQLDGADWRLRSPPAAMDVARAALHSPQYEGGSAALLAAHERMFSEARPGNAQAVADFDGDGASDRALYNAGTGTWSVAGQGETGWGTAGDVQVSADYDGDGRTDTAVYRPGTATWWVRGIATTAWGAAGDVPVAADYNGDRQADLAIWRPSTGTWWVRGIATTAWGQAGDVPVPGDYNADGRADLAIWRPSTGTWWIRGIAAIPYGQAGDVPVPGDFDGDGRSDLAVWRPSDGTWYVRGVRSGTLGRDGDVPAPGDYDGDGVTDFAVYRPSTQTWIYDGTTSTFGTSAARPVALPAAIARRVPQ